MSIIVSCKCGKRFSAKDEYAGKKAACPGCRQVLLIPRPAGEDAIALDEPVASVPAKATARRPQQEEPGGGTAAPAKPVVRAMVYPGSSRPGAQQKTSPAFAVSPKMIMFLSLLILVPTAIFLFKAGPVKAMAQWQELEPKLNGYTSDAVKRVLEKETEGVTFGELVRPPKVTNVMLDGPIMMWSLPADIRVQGKTTEGHFNGVYHTGPRSFELEVGVHYDRTTRHLKAHVTDPSGEVAVDELK